MCGGAIIFDFIPSNRGETKRLTASQLLNSVPSYYSNSKPIKTLELIFDLAEDDFKADFREFKDEYAEEEDVKPLSFPKLSFSSSSSELSTIVKSHELEDQSRKNAKWKRKNVLQGICQCPWGKWIAEISHPRKGVCVWLGTFNIV